MATVIDRNTSQTGYHDLNQHELRNPQLHQLGSDPGSPVNGQILYRTDTNKIRARINGAWFDLATTADVSAGGISASIGTTKGDIISFTGSATPVRKGVGSNKQLLAADSSQTDGLLWASPDHTYISDFDTQVRTSTLNQMTAPTADLSINSHKLINVLDGTASSDAATFGQLNAILTGQVWKQPVQGASAANLTLATGFAAGQVIDGYTLVLGDRFLIKNQTAGQDNGIYIITAGTPTRATDADVTAELQNATVIILNGTNNKGDIYTQTATVTTVGTTSQTWVKTGEGNQTYTASGGVTLTGSNFDTTVSGLSGGYAVGDLLYASGAAALSRLADAATGNALISGGTTTAPSWGKIGLSTHVSGTLAEGNGGTNQSTYTTGDLLQASATNTLSKLAAVATGNVLISGGVTTASSWGKVGLTTHVSGVLPEANGGTNASTFAGALATANGARKYSQDLTGGSTSEVVTHSLGTRDVQVQVYRQTTPWDTVDTEVERTSTSTITIRTPGTIAASTYRVVVTG